MMYNLLHSYARAIWQKSQQVLCHFFNRHSRILQKITNIILSQGEWRMFSKVLPQTYIHILIDFGGSVYVHLIHGIICNVGK